MKKPLVLLLFSLIFSTAFSQKTFTKRIGQLFEPTSIAENSDSSLLVAGGYRNDGNYSSLKKLTSTGDSLWLKVYDTLQTGSSPRPKIQIDGEGNIFMLSFIAHDHTIIRKLDSEGNVIWRRDLSSYVSAFFSTDVGDVLAAGASEGRPYLIKLNANGDSINSKFFSRPPDRMIYNASTICPSGEENFLVLYTGDFAVTYGYTGFSYGITVNADFDSTGSFLFGEYGCQIIKDVVKTNENFLFAGFTDSETSQQYTSYFINTDMEFNINWSRTNELEYAEYIPAVALSQDKEWIYAGGQSYQEDIILLKINVGDGSTGWVRQFQEGLNSYANDVICTKDGGILICGYLEDLRGAPYYGILVKVDESGNFNGIDNKDNSGVISLSPNPAKGNVNLKWISSGGQDKIRIMDVRGVVLKTAAINGKPAEEVITTIDISDLSEGFYFCSIVSGESVHTSKLIIK